MRHIACLTLFALAAGSASAAEDAEMPTYEQIQKVAKTTEVNEAEAEAAYALDDVVVSASRRREVAYRYIQLALERKRSDKVEDADLTVCRKVAKPGSHILQTMCATNRTWNYIRVKSTRDVYGMAGGAQAPYPVTDGPVYQINQTYINRMSQEFDRNSDHEGRLKQLLATDAAERLTDEHATPAETVVRFARAFGAVSALKNADDAALEQAITGAGLTVDQYNEYVARLESSPRFKARVSAALEAAR